MWPPRRSVGRKGSSRLTRSPSASSPSELRATVSALRSAEKDSESGSTAVRQTPLTATESPAASSFASEASIRRRNPPPSRATAATRPSSWTIPVNNLAPRLPLAEPRLDQHVIADRLHPHRIRMLGVLDRVGTLALHRHP